MSQTKRNLGLEYLRILSMFLIILLHSIDHSGLLESLVPGTALYAWERLFYALCQVCVNCFVMLSGYFLVDSRFRIGKLLMLWMQVVFYSLGIKLIFMISGMIPFSLTSIASCFVPVFTGRYWFVTIYFGMYLLFPFLNILINGMDRRKHSILCLLLIGLMSGMVSIHPAFAGMNSGGGWGLAWFVSLYLIAAWLRRYGIPANGKSAGWYAAGYLLCGILPWVATLAADHLEIEILQDAAANWYRYDSIFACVGSICLFCFFGSYIKNKKGLDVATPWTTALSGATFGVYLIHAHADICVPAFWQRVGILSLRSQVWFPLYQIGLAAGIFAVCAAIELGRKMLFRLLRIDTLTERLQAAIQNHLREEKT